MDGLVDGTTFVIISDGSENYIRISDVLTILSAEYSPKDRDDIADLLQGIVTSASPENMRMN
jgi:hypothetical protein